MEHRHGGAYYSTRKWCQSRGLVVPLSVSDWNQFGVSCNILKVRLTWRDDITDLLILKYVGYTQQHLGLSRGLDRREGQRRGLVQSSHHHSAEE
jgi:hypothetical protein